ncbi:CRISPR-associated endoribonuclease Cas2 [Clostridium acetireducens DSM 10703]|jgi:CRISPR-associated protein Cas2|uniref:CRISPR-associated endoribonuclease Cas2 n=1 Tax=Clostridium acetireducens DSM 10703 TaxID=1121290 RepID=A0A1E8EWZ2_9CLOT|nr:CRISPR-associated endonuclease Cas2 [Clostridium acetireducens]OFI05275.1 CRISPR-associated endoribonuclease Cas2 [Clostridium acetireducens DSM 10703]
MFVILVYDFEQKRVGRALKTCRKYLTWVQNSVFEGEIGEANLKKLKMELNKLMDKSTDSVIIYSFQSTKYSKREVLGVSKNSQEFIL